MRQQWVDAVKQILLSESVGSDEDDVASAEISGERKNSEEGKKLRQKTFISSPFVLIY